LPFFGNTTPGSTPGGNSANFKVVCSFPLSENIVVSKLNMYLDGVFATQQVRGIIYADNAGVPGALIGVTVEVVIGISQPAGWVVFPLPAPIAMSPGTYWLGDWYGATDGASRMYTDAGSQTYNSETYSSTLNPSDPFGTPNTAGTLRSIYSDGVTSGETISIGFRAGGPAGPY
jgi:hypothetical protein